MNLIKKNLNAFSWLFYLILTFFVFAILFLTFQKVVLIQYLILLISAAFLIFYILLIVNSSLHKNFYVPRVMLKWFYVACALQKLIFRDEEFLKPYISLKNKLVSFKAPRKYKNILILLPHCVQNYDCKIKITSDIKNCVECGKCIVSEIRRITSNYGVKNVKIATGGTQARRIVGETRPDAIIACACERDLSSGMFDVDGKIPVFGLINERPEGPCKNTVFDIVKFEALIKKLTAVKQ